MSKAKNERQIHSQLLLFLNRNMPEGTNEYDALRVASKAHLTPLDMKWKTVSDLADKLTNNGDCGVGNYGTLKTIIQEATKNEEILDKIDDAHKRIQASKRGTPNSSAAAIVKQEPATTGQAPITDDATRPVDENLFHRIAQKASGDWKGLLRELGLQAADIDRIEIENNMVTDSVFKGLCKWRIDTAERATRALLREKIGKYIAYQDLHELFSNDGKI